MIVLVRSASLARATLSASRNRRHIIGSERMDKTVGIIGLGIMGGAIARNLVERGWRVIGFDTDAARC
ncbi:MAG: NAD(P)-binding domain-containing protein, partial [Xanthobacteraceae bacterium]